MKNLIIGYDSGLNLGLAILDTEGKLLLLKTYRGEEKEKVITEILKYGRPIVFSTDKRKVPKSIKEVASSFGCKILRPKRDLMVEEKEELVKNFEVEIKDDHQRDALAAAYYAFKKIRKRLDLIKEYLKRKNLLEFYDEVVYKFFRHVGVNLVSILEELTKKEERIEVRSEKAEKAKQIDFFEESLRLKKRIRELERELEYYRKLNLIFSELLDYKEKYIKLEKYFALLKKIYEIENKNMISIIDLDCYEINEVESYIGLENKVVFSNDEKKFNILKGFGVRALLTEIDIDKQKSIKIPVFRVKKEELANFDGVYGIEKKKFEKMMKEVLKEEVKKWVEEERLR